MAKLLHCGILNKSKAHRLVSNTKAFPYQVLYITEKCKGSCGLECMKWAGENPDGSISGLYEIPRSEYAHWRKRIDIKRGDLAKPEAQLMSEWAERAARPADIAVYYHNTLKTAQRWWKGSKI